MVGEVWQNGAAEERVEDKGDELNDAIQQFHWSSVVIALSDNCERKQGPVDEDPINQRTSLTPDYLWPATKEGRSASVAVEV